MDKHQVRIFYLIFLSMALLIIICFISLHTSPSGVIIVGLIVAPVLSYTLLWSMDLFSTVFTLLIYGVDHSDISYESQFYQEDMAKAKRLVREEKWNEAILAYHWIINMVPRKCEPRFNLARLYEKGGYFGLALSEYKKIVNLKDELGPNHAFVIESERAIEELPRLMKDNVQS